MTIKFSTREEWLEAAMSELSPLFHELGKPLPDRIRLTCGFGSGGTRKRGGKAMIGECWDASRSGDASFEIMISPVDDEPLRVLATLAHELCHAAAGLDQKHHGAFVPLARGLKLEGPLTATFGGGEFETLTKTIVETLGDYPHAKLDTSLRSKQGTRMIKCVCPTCSYTVRTTAKWLLVGLPRCPIHGALSAI